MPTLVHPGVAPYGFSRNLKIAYGGPDPGKVRSQLQYLQDYWKEVGAREFMYNFCWIQRKNPEPGAKEVLPTDSKFWNRRLVPFLYNQIQTQLEPRLGRRNIFLKMRQGGYTTFMIGRRLFIPCILEPGSNGLLISQNGDYATAHFRILQRFYKLFAVVDPYDKSRNKFAQELHQHLLHTTITNRRELIFDQLDVAIRCASAEVSEVGQGLTITHAVCTEVARWPGKPEETLANMKEGIPGDGTLDIESTANGFGGYFHEECMRARDKGKELREFTYHFHEWWWHEEYTAERFEGMKAANPETYTNEEKKLVAAQNLTPGQIGWRRFKKEELRGDFDEKYPEDDLTCFLLSGSQYFDREILRARYIELKSYVPLRKADKIEIYKKPIKHRNYIIGADVASGLEVGTDKLDWSAAVVIDEETGEECAAYHDQLLPEEYGWDLADLGHEYNDALIAVERNEDGGTVLLTLEVACMYMNLYKHMDWWKKDWRKAGGNKVKGASQGMRIREITGFLTNLKTRPLALNRIRWFVHEHPELIWDIGFIEECLTFVRNQDKRGKPEAAPGAHDDRVMCRGIAQYVRNVRLGYLVPEQLPPRPEKYGSTPTECLELDEVDELPKE